MTLIVCGYCMSTRVQGQGGMAARRGRADERSRSVLEHQLVGTEDRHQDGDDDAGDNHAEPDDKDRLE